MSNFYRFFSAGKSFEAWLIYMPVKSYIEILKAKMSFWLTMLKSNWSISVSVLNWIEPLADEIHLLVRLIGWLQKSLLAMRIQMQLMTTDPTCGAWELLPLKWPKLSLRCATCILCEPCSWFHETLLRDSSLRGGVRSSRTLSRRSWWRTTISGPTLNNSSSILLSKTSLMKDKLAFRSRTYLTELKSTR